ncbi:MAG TPA: glycosyltransferase family 9 protein [Thermomicrobiales bacterium]|nr:glycosyltransferase family 9 protein [Thermomicrobiales bacterium]
MLPTCPPIPDVRKIAVLRAGGLGDLLFALPAIEALRAAYPGAEIVLLGREGLADLLPGRFPAVDRAVAIPPARGVGQPEDYPEEPNILASFFAAMAAERFDLAFQLHGGGGFSNPFTRRLRARVTIGLKAPEAAALDRWVPYVYFQPEVMRYLEVVALAGARPTVLAPRLTPTAADRAEAARALPADGRPLAVIHPGATDPRRWWPTERFATVGDALAATGARVAVIGHEENERALVATVCEGMAADAADLRGRLSLGGLAALLARARVVVGNDSGPLHLAEAVGAATVGVYWCFNLINGAPFTRARHRPLVSARFDCPICGVNCLTGHCEHRASFVADVPAADVIAVTLDLWERESVERGA